MMQENPHLSDQDLLLWADGELSSQHAAEIQRHLSTCWTCRTRTAELEHVIADFVHIYRHEFDVKLPPIEGPRALLKAHLAEGMASSRAGSNGWFNRRRQVRAASAVAAVLLLAGVVIRISLHGNARSESRQTTYLSSIGAIPNASLTPGATDPTSFQDVCSAKFSTNDPAISDSLRREVLKEYGLSDASSNSYEIDYLVTPQLGGTTNIRNLWPEPSFNTVWNARVKDALEDRLHDLVCSGRLDLATAQREISENWVAAYKKYFRTDEPLQKRSGWRAISTSRRDVLLALLLWRGLASNN
jgi:hypothetical protein